MSRDRRLRCEKREREKKREVKTRKKREPLLGVTVRETGGGTFVSPLGELNELPRAEG